MKIAAAMILSAFVAATIGLSPAQAQQCPTGAYPFVDSWGNKICKRFSDGGASTTEVPKGQTCPTGSHPWADTWGNKICRSFNAPNQPRTDYYDTSKGCPTGMYPTMDSFGNNVCKRF